MNREEQKAIKFGFKIMLIWLTILTGIIMYDKMSIGSKINQTILLPPPIQEMEVYDYGINE